jgi:TrmH family RNA methyltransferase
LAANAQFERLRVVLVNTRNPLNIGAAARAMSNFGFSQLRVVNPYELAFREARSAVGAAPLLAAAEEFKSVAEAAADCSLVVGTTAVGSRELQHPLRTLEQAAPLIRKRLTTGPVALLFGSEKRGLSNEDLSHCHWLLRIPTREEHRSMNLGQAVAVCLYEIARDPKPSTRPEKAIAAPSGDLERITAILLDVLRASGYLKPQSPGTTKTRADRKPRTRAREQSKAATTSLSEEKIRRLVRRLNLSAIDAELLLGMIRQVRWSMLRGVMSADLK